MGSPLGQGVPGLPAKMVDENGAPLPAWFAFFVNLWKRTGGGTASLTGLLDNISQTPGSLIFRGVSVWTGLGPGTRYQALRAGQPYPEWDWLDGNSFQPQGAGQFFAGPAGAAGAVAFRSIASSDLGGVAGQIPGTATNDNAAAGDVGEYIASQVNAGQAVALTSGTPTNITSIALTPGDWDLWGSIASALGSGTAQSQIRAWISTASATDPGNPNGGALTSMSLPGPTIMPIGAMRLSLQNATTVYLSTTVTFTSGSLSAYGFLGARRRR